MRRLRWPQDTLAAGSGVGCRMCQSCSAEGPRSVGPHVLLLRETPVVSAVLALPSLPSTFISVFVLFFFRTWSLPGILYLLSCVLTRRPALLPADVHGWAPRLCSRLGHAGRLLPWMGAGGWRLVAGGSAMWVCWGFNTTVL